MKRLAEHTIPGIIDEERLRFILQASGLGVWDFDTVNKTVHWDLRCREMHGFGGADEYVAYEDTLKHIHPDDRGRADAEVQRVLTPGSDGNFCCEFRILQDEQTPLRWLRSVGTVFFDADNKPYRFSGTTQDITSEVNEKKAKEAVESHLRVAVEAASLGTFHINTNTGHMTYTPELSRIITGVVEEGHKRDMLVQHLHPEDHGVREQAYKVMEQTGVLNYTCRFVWRDGSVHYVKVRGKNGYDKDGKLTSFSGVVQDVTADMELLAKENKLLSLVSNSNDYMGIADMDNRVNYLNAAGRKLLGIKADADITQYTTPDFYTPAEYERVMKMVGPALENQGAWRGMVKMRHFVNGEEIPCYADYQVINDPHTGQPIAKSATVRDMRPQLKTQEAIRTSEQRFRKLVMDSPMAVGIFRGQDLVVEVANDAILRIWGKTKEVVGQSLPATSPELIEQGYIDLFRSVLQTGEAYHGNEAKVILNQEAGARQGYFNFVVVPVREVDNTITGVMVIAIEVTDTVNAKEAMRASEHRFRNLIKDAPFALGFYTGREINIELVNDEMLKLWGRDKSIIGMPLVKALPELEGQPFPQLLDDVYTTGITYTTAEQRADLMIDGEMRTGYYNFTYKPLMDGEGKVFAILHSAVEVTQQVLARKSIEEARNSMEGAIELAELGTWDYDLKTGVVSLSDRICEWFGLGKECGIEDVLNAIHPKDRERIKKAVEDAMLPGNSARYDEEYRVINKDTGVKKILHAQGIAYFGDDGTPLRLTGTAQDITLQRDTEAELKRQVDMRTQWLQDANMGLSRVNNDLEQFAYVASHDLQEPLRKIKMFTDMLLTKHGKEMSDTALSYLERIASSSTRMAMLIRNVLDFSRVRTHEDDFEDVSLQEVISKVQEDLELTIAEKGVTLQVGELPVIKAIPLQMYQIFYNLVGNATKFTRKDVPPVIEISAVTPTRETLKQCRLLSDVRYAEIIVKDNGIGFRQEFAGQIFDIFQRLHTREQFEGTGIGLALCRKIATEHDGEIFAIGKEGGGAEFHVLLPVQGRA